MSTTPARTFGAIFDIDGTLVDSYEAHFKSWHDVLAGNGIEYGQELFKRDFGRRNPEIITELWNEVGRDAPSATLIDEISDEKEADFRRILAADFPEMPGASTLLERLHEAGWGLAVGSSAPGPNVMLSIEGLGATDLFDVIVCGTDGARGKPEPDVFLRGAELLGLEPEACIVIEDAAPGVEAAHRAGMIAVAIASQGRTREELAEAELVIDSLEELDPQRLSALMKEYST